MKDNERLLFRVEEMEKERQIKIKEFENIKLSYGFLNNEVQQKNKENQNLLHQNNLLSTECHKVTKRYEQL